MKQVFTKTQPGGLYPIIRRVRRPLIEVGVPVKVVELVPVVAPPPPPTQPEVPDGQVPAVERRSRRN